ncbi:MAG: hypothetical protein ACJ8FU_05700, partial [Xanthobacteraceae bacterium]
FAISPGDFEDITEMLVPELVRRGRYKDAYRPGTLREKLFGKDRARLTAPHPAARYRPNLTARAAESIALVALDKRQAFARGSDGRVTARHRQRLLSVWRRAA